MGLRYYFGTIADTFSFGRYKSYTLEEVLANNPSYFYWCLSHIPSFVIAPRVIEEIRECFPHLPIPLDIKRNVDYECDSAFDEDEKYEYEDDVASDYEEETYDRYNGSWAQDVEGYSDDEIDTLFDGDPSAYWNID